MDASAGFSVRGFLLWRGRGIFVFSHTEIGGWFVMTCGLTSFPEGHLSVNMCPKVLLVW